MAEIPMTPDQWKAMLESMNAVKEAQQIKLLPEKPLTTSSPLTFPPGNAGHIARFIYGAAPRPVTEVAVVGALGFLAGICGKAWSIPGSGLNIYLVLVARSAIGKEAMLKGVSKLFLVIAREAPAASRFVDFTEYASGPALIKACVANPSFVNVSGEIGRRIKGMSAAKSSDPLSTLRTQMTNLYHKSSMDSTVGGIGYSATENNVQSVMGVSYSMIGETTPGTFLESLTKDMMEDGFMSRLTVIEYDGERPDRNRAPQAEPPAYLVDMLVPLVKQADMLIAKDESQPIGRTESVAIKMDAFEDECDSNIKASGANESRRQMWNRAALKAFRIAGLLAVADNYIYPMIDDGHIDWAIGLVRRDIATFSKRLESGDVGDGDNACFDKLMSVLKHYITHELSDGYKVPSGMQQNSIVPHNYLSQRTRNHAAFYNHKLGAARALDATIYAMINSGCLIEVQKDKLVEGYSFHGKGYRIVALNQ
ncbi:DUF3987 domain-containing protein [Celeribacter baekdonensis]|uniref:DUF3987 domain-containing protein n=1 Tax=Celeribacter baekdonensis TaxID=875171 RepID=UPI0030DA96B4|tara:strand:- start:259704 stop:261143 length:1440 start_codon:yes stop_codon:yes gene_type:complete